LIEAFDPAPACLWRVRAALPLTLPAALPAAPPRSGMVAMIMMRTLHRDISKYNQLETAEEAQEETGWKLVRALEAWGGCCAGSCGNANC